MANIEKEENSLMETCIGTTKKGKRCMRQTNCGLKYCWCHKTQEPQNLDMDTARFNEECPICFTDESKGMLILSCLHKIHAECAEGLTDLLCPMCRKEANNWPKNLLIQIKKNIAERKQELIDEETQHLREQEQHIRSMMMSQMTLLTQPPPQIEITGALQYLREQGIPMYYIPQRIRISRARGQLNPQPGILFTIIVGQVLEKVQEDIAMGSLQVGREHPIEDDNSGDESNNYDETENPFEEENELFTEIDRIVNFVEID